MAGSQTPLPRSGRMQLQPVPTRQSSVTEKQLHFSEGGPGSSVQTLGFTPTPLLEFTQPNCQHSVSVSKNPAWHSSGAATAGLPGVPSAGEGHSDQGEQWPEAPSCLPPLRGSASLSPPEGTEPGARVWLLPLCRPWPLAGGPEGPHRRCPLLGPHRETGSRRGGWGWGAAPSPDCPASLPGSSPSGSRPSLAAGGDLPCLGDSEGAAAGENPPAPPAAEGGKGKGARGAPPES